MALETTIFTFMISVLYEDWVKGFDCLEVDAMHKANGMTALYRGVSKNDPQSIIVIHQARRELQSIF